jgi:hypothetical protein
MSDESMAPPAWMARGKTIRQLIKELQSFENQDLLVEISLDGGVIQKPISLVKKSKGVCLLTYSGP